MDIKALHSLDHTKLECICSGESSVIPTFVPLCACVLGGWGASLVSPLLEGIHSRWLLLITFQAKGTLSQPTEGSNILAMPNVGGTVILATVPSWAGPATMGSWSHSLACVFSFRLRVSPIPWPWPTLFDLLPSHSYPVCIWDISSASVYRGYFCKGRLWKAPPTLYGSRGDLSAATLWSGGAATLLNLCFQEVVRVLFSCSEVL